MTIVIILWGVWYVPVITQDRAVDTARASHPQQPYAQDQPTPILELSHAKIVTVLRTGNLTPDRFFLDLYDSGTRDT